MTEKSAENFIPGEDELDAQKVVVNFNVNDARIAEAKEEFKDIDASKNFVRAKEAAKVCQKMRATLTDAHKLQKADALEVCRVLDAEKRRLLVLILEVEDPIKAQITAIEDAEKLKEQERFERIQAQIAVIRHYGFDLDDLEVIDLQKLQERLATVELDSSYEEFLVEAEGAKAESESRLRIAINKAQAREEYESKLELQRQEQEEQQAKLDEKQAELDKQQAEADERDRKTKEEQAKRDRIVRENKDRELAEKQADLDKQKAEQDEHDRVEREAKEAEEAAARAAELAPDREKLDKLAGILEQLSMPTVESQQAKDIVTYVSAEMRNVGHWIRRHAGEME